MANQNFVAILMGSSSDLKTMEHCITILKEFNIPHEVKILSAHRTPTQTQEYIETADKRGCQVFIAAAGLAAHLAGATAAHTVKPVIGVPIAAGSLQGMDALLSTVQMPGGIPVATVAIGNAGAKNSAYLAAQILALQDKTISKKLKEIRQQNAEKILKDNANLNSESL